MPLVQNDAHGNGDSWAAVESAPLFTGFSPEDFKRIFNAGRLHWLDRGQMLYLEGDTVQQVLLLVSGSIKITQMGSKGLDVILRLGAPGDVFDVVSLSTTGRHRTTAAAIRSCGVLVWDAGAFKGLLEAIPVLHQNVIRFTYGHLEELERRFRELATERVGPRVARQLIRLQEQVGSAQNDEMEIRLSREDLAQMTGTTLYTISRLLAAWEERGLVNSCGGSMVLSDVRALRNLFEGN